MSEPTTPDLSSLTDDGDSIVLPDGRKLTLRIEPDEWAGGWNDQMDAECYGTVQWERGRDRPANFDGAARKILTDGSLTCWWQPPTAKAIGTVWTTEQWAEQTAYVRDRIEDGWYLVGLELSEVLVDSIGNEHRVVLDTAWLGGVDDVSGDYLPEILGDNYYEVVARVDTASAKV